MESLEKQLNRKAYFLLGNFQVSEDTPAFLEENTQIYRENTEFKILLLNCILKDCSFKQISVLDSFSKLLSYRDVFFNQVNDWR